MSISVVSTNIFRGQDQLGHLLKSLAAQTCQDFEWVLVDAFWAENRQLVAEMAAAHGLRDVVHVPFTGNRNVGATYTWSTYNEALLLARHPTLLRVGVYRYIHHEVVALAAELATWGACLCLSQRDVDRFEDLTHAAMVEKYDLNVDARTVVPDGRMQSPCGMFSYGRDALLAMNGNNEAWLVHHSEDAELNSRWRQAPPVHLVRLDNAMLRVYHSKCRTLTYSPKWPCDKADNPACVVHAANNHELEKYAHPDTEWRDHAGFPWARCRTCNAVAAGYCDKYYKFAAADPRGARAPVGVFGLVGRDLAAVRDDLARCVSLQSKVELLAASHTNPKYLGL